MIRFISACMPVHSTAWARSHYLPTCCGSWCGKFSPQQESRGNTGIVLPLNTTGLPALPFTETMEYYCSYLSWVIHPSYVLRAILSVLCTLSDFILQNVPEIKKLHSYPLEQKGKENRLSPLHRVYETKKEQEDMEPLIQKLWMEGRELRAICKRLGSSALW